MEYRPLGRTTLQVSSIGMGCVTFGREIDRAASFEVLDHAHERGITLFDTAEAYAGGASERVLGEWLSERRVRDAVVVATKVAGTLTRSRIVRSAEESLRRLRTDRIDLFQLHHWDEGTPVDETLAALEDLVQSGKVRAIGVSNWQAWQVCRALVRATQHGGIRVESVQPPYNLVQREAEPDLLPLCVDQQLAFISYSPLGAGFLTGKYQPGRKVPEGTRFDVIPGHQPIYFTPTGYRVLEGLQTMASESGRPAVDLALAWVLGQPGVTSMLVGARCREHIDQALRAQAAGLSEELRRRLSGL